MDKRKKQAQRVIEEYKRILALKGDDPYSWSDLASPDYMYFGLPVEITFVTGFFFCRPKNNSFRILSSLKTLYDSPEKELFPVLDLPKELKPILDKGALSIYDDDPPEEVKRKLYESNSKTTFVLRQYAKTFESETNISEAWRMIAADYPDIDKLGSTLTLNANLAALYLLTCLRCELLREDYRKRHINFQPTYCFENPTYMFTAWNSRTKGAPTGLYASQIHTFVYDLMNFILCSYVNREEEPSSFIFLNWDDEELTQLSGMKSIYKYADKKLIRTVLCSLYTFCSLFYSVILQIEQEDLSVIEKDSDLTIIKKIFRIASKLESYAMNF